MSKVINNFAGLNGFVWWTGVVENRNDPLKLGRCQVRIFGWHTEDKNLIPTADLPWALPIHPSNNSENFSTPKEGEYVTGFFADAESGQFPIMMGVLPGVITTSLAAGAGGDSGFYDPRTAKEIDAAPKAPQGIVLKSQGQPSISPTARGVYENTALQKAYNSISHNCDITAEAALAIAKLRAEVMGAVKKLRELIEAFFAATVGSPVFEQIKQAITNAINKIKQIQKELKPIVDLIKAIEKYIQLAAAIVKYILSLPARLIQLLKDCLAKFTSVIDLAKKELLGATSTAASLVKSASTTIDVINTAKDALTKSTTTITKAVKPMLA
jgi:hypothetical protein